MKLNIAVIPGDGIGPEVTGEAMRVISLIGEIFCHQITFRQAQAGGAAIDQTGEALPKSCLEICKDADSVLLGAVGGRQWDHLPGDRRPERALLGLRQGLGLYANLRPAVIRPALINACPLRTDIAEAGIDIMMVRELTGGLYFGERGRRQTERGEAAWDTEQYSVEEISRIAVMAFSIARRRKKRLTSVDKANVLETSRLWRETVQKMAEDFPDVTLDHLYVDNASMQLIREPSRFDVVVTTNMFGDILSDETGQIIGSIGLLPSASLGVFGFGLYEPIHGSAPDIAGKNIANPLAAILSAAMMFRHSFQLEEEAAAIEVAVDQTLAAGFRTADIFCEGTIRIGTREMGAQVLKFINKRGDLC